MHIRIEAKKKIMEKRKKKQLAIDLKTTQKKWK